MVEPCASIKFSLTKLTWPALSQSYFSLFWPVSKIWKVLFNSWTFKQFVPYLLRGILEIFRELTLNFKIFETIYCKVSTIYFSFYHLTMCSYFWDMCFFKNLVKKECFPKYPPDLQLHPPLCFITEISSVETL